MPAQILHAHLLWISCNAKTPTPIRICHLRHRSSGSQVLYQVEGGIGYVYLFTNFAFLVRIDCEGGEVECGSGE